MFLVTINNQRAGRVNRWPRAGDQMQADVSPLTSASCQHGPDTHNRKADKCRVWQPPPLLC